MPEPKDTADHNERRLDDAFPQSRPTTPLSLEVDTPEPRTPKVDLDVANFRLAIKQYKLATVVALIGALTLIATISPEFFPHYASSLWQLIQGTKQVHLPKVDSTKFTVLVAELEHDDKNHAQEAIVTSLEGTAGVVVEPLNTIIPAGKTSEVEAGQAVARRYLKDSGAKLIIWGSYLGIDGRETINLFLTPFQIADMADAAPRLYEFVPDLVIDPSFLGDLVQAIQLAVQDYVTTSHTTESCSNTAQQLSRLIDDVRQRVDGDKARSWSPISRISVRISLAAALRTFSTITGDPEPGREAVEMCRIAVAEATPHSDTWARGQLQLGASSLAMLKWEMPADKSRNSKQALDAFQAAAGVLRTGNQAKIVKLMIGTVLLEKAITVSPPDERMIQEALTTLRETLRSVDRQQEPLLWGQTRLMVGLGLFASALRPGDHRILLAEAQSALQESLEVTRERSPLTWAVTQTMSGMTSRVLSSSDSPNGVYHLRDSIEAFNQALTIESRSCTPVEWADTQHELGIALALLGTSEKNGGDFRKAEQAYQSELEVHTPEHFPPKWTIAQVELSSVLGLRGNLEHNPLLLCQALHRALICAAVEKDCAQPATPIVNAAYYSLVHSFSKSDGENCQAKLEENFANLPFDLSKPTTDFSNLVCAPRRK